MIILSALIANLSWDWMIERGEVLWRVEWPTGDGAHLTILARWVAGVLLAAGGVIVRRWRRGHLPSAARKVGEAPAASPGLWTWAGGAWSRLSAHGSAGRKTV
jgi:hypothetical protein